MNKEEHIFEKKWMLTVFYIICLAAVVAFSWYHLDRILNSDIESVRATERVTVNSLEFMGYIARDEKMIIDGSGGIIASPYPNASKHVEGEACVAVYPESCASLIEKTDRLNEKLSVISDVMNYSSVSSAENAISFSYSELMKKYAYGDPNTAGEMSEFVKSVLSREYVFDKNSLQKLYNETKKELEDLLAELEVQNEVREGVMPYTGYMFKNSDRFFDVFDADLAITGSADEILSVIDAYNEETDLSQNIATAARSGRWYILAPITEAFESVLEKGRTYEATADGVSLKAELMDIRHSKNADGFVAVFAVDELPGKLDYQRKMKVSLRISEEQTYLVPVSAVRTAKSGETGVYIISGGVILFRRVEVVKSTETYVLVKSYNSYMDSLTDEKNAEDMYSMICGDSRDVGIYRGNSYASFEGSIYDNGTVLIKTPTGDVKINTHTDDEPSDYAYLGENELIIISGKKLYHGKVLS